MRIGASVVVIAALLGAAHAARPEAVIDARARRTRAADHARVTAAARTAQMNPRGAAELVLHPERQFDVTGYAATGALATYQAARALLHADARGDARFDRAAVRARLAEQPRPTDLPGWAGKRAIAFVSNRNRRGSKVLAQGTLVHSLGAPRDPAYQFSVRLRIKEGKTNDKQRLDVRITDDEVHLQQDVRLAPGMRRDEVALRLLAATHGFLDGTFALVGPDGRERTIRLDLRFVDDPRVPLLETPSWWGRSNTSTLYANATTRTAAHEVTHRLFGAPDTYHDVERSPHRNLRPRVRGGEKVAAMMDTHETGAPMPADARAIAKLVEAVTGERVVIARARPMPAPSFGAQPPWKGLSAGDKLPLPEGESFTIEPTPGAVRVEVPRDKVTGIAKDPAGSIWVRVRGYHRPIQIAGYEQAPGNWIAARVPLALTAGP